MYVNTYFFLFLRSEAMKMLIIFFPRVEIKPTTCRAYSHSLAPLRLFWTYIGISYVIFTLYPAYSRVGRMNLDLRNFTS